MKIAYITKEQAESLDQSSFGREIRQNRELASYLPGGAVGMWNEWMICVQVGTEDVLELPPHVTGREILDKLDRLSGYDDARFQSHQEVVETPKDRIADEEYAWKSTLAADAEVIRNAGREEVIQYHAAVVEKIMVKRREIFKKYGGREGAYAAGDFRLILLDEMLDVFGKPDV